jgi:hypothetical protein
MLADKGAFHPGAFHALVRCTGLYPPGSRVLLSSGERALVLASGEDIERPRVRITHASGGASLPTDETRELDLATAPAIGITRMLEDIAPPTTAESGRAPLLTHGARSFARTRSIARGLRTQFRGFEQGLADLVETTLDGRPRRPTTSCTTIRARAGSRGAPPDECSAERCDPVSSWPIASVWMSCVPS